jgi:signal transduction histidine kinase
MSLDESTHSLNRRRRFIEGLLSRVVVSSVFATLFVVLASLRTGLTWEQVAPALAILGVIALVNIPYWFAGKRYGFPLNQFYMHWAGDLLMITALAYYLGGLDVPLMQFGYLMMILTGALFVSQRAAYHLATGATLVYGLLGIAETFGFIPHRSGIWSHHYGTETRLFIIIISGGFFYIMAYLAGTLSELLRKANQELSTTKALVEEQNVLLEQRVRERTRELEARTLQLQERTDELEELVYIVTHDLQNVAVASAETARKLLEGDGAELSARGRRYVERLVRDGRLMSTMLRNLLEVVNQTEVVERRERVDVASVVRDAVARAQSVIERKGIEVAIGDLPPVYAEQQKITHVFENLISNACKYVGDKQTAKISLRGEEGDGVVEYSVSDNGVGIEDSQLSRIFQLYHRAPDQDVGGEIQQGYGIGLAVVKRIVQRYGGKIWVESARGSGSTFHVTFPREDRQEVRQGATG